MSRRPRFTALPLLAAASTGICLAAGCGGSSKPKTATTKTSPTKTAQRHTRPLPFLVVAAKTTSDSVSGQSVLASPGDRIAIIARVPGAKTKPATVTLNIPSGPSRKLMIKVAADGHNAAIKVGSATGSPLTLLEPHYACSLPPEPTFCPAHKVGSISGGVKVSFASTPAASIVLLATVGPVSLPTPKVTTPGSSVVPPYTVTALVRAIPKGAKSKSLHRPSPSASVKPGDSIAVMSHLTSKVRGAPQPVKITLNQGPGTSITLSASVPGGAMSTATVKSANGKPIELVLPQYSCSLPPSPTFCPPTAVTVGAHRYSITFMAAPGTLEPTLVVHVQSA